ncbi:MAG: sulfite exporter TauE/SafE family protein [Thermodesulfovibrio sp.]|nr:sulfite exporter TauE/SafE family protein [Thermodesulfovibrio sp.]
MCGPLVASCTLSAVPRKLSQRHSNGPSPGVMAGQLIFHAGRITTYTCIGGMAGLTGSFMNSAGKLAGIQNIVPILAGLFMIWMGLGIVGITHSTAVLEGRNNLVIKGVREILQGDSVWRFYPIGLLLGFLPCGLSYSVFIGAAGSGGLLQGLLFSLLFGLGTIPALLMASSLAAVVGQKVRGYFYRAGGLLIIVMGILFLLRGIRSYANM